jgi:hypothetical protein
MNEPALLLVEILETKGRKSKVRTLLEDDTEVIFEAPTYEIMPIKGNPPRGWLNVVFSGENNKRASVTLPTPILNMGHRITVSTSRIKRPEEVSTMQQPKMPVIVPPRITKAKKIKMVDSKRSAAAKKAWETRRKNSEE